jgi:hypothetical protein
MTGHGVPDQIVDILGQVHAPRAPRRHQMEVDEARRQRNEAIRERDAMRKEMLRYRNATKRAYRLLSNMAPPYLKQASDRKWADEAQEVLREASSRASRKEGPRS